MPLSDRTNTRGVGWRLGMSDMFFFFQAEDGIRDFTVTGVQTCALPIFRVGRMGHPYRQCSISGSRTRWESRWLSGEQLEDGFWRNSSRFLPLERQMRGK